MGDPITRSSPLSILTLQALPEGAQALNDIYLSSPVTINQEVIRTLRLTLSKAAIDDGQSEVWLVCGMYGGGCCGEKWIDSRGG